MVVGRLWTTFSSVSAVQDMQVSLFRVVGDHHGWFQAPWMPYLFEFLKGFSLTARLFAIMLCLGCGIWKECNARIFGDHTTLACFCLQYALLFIRPVRESLELISKETGNSRVMSLVRFW
ncbi:hypothetical protein OIU78_020767 [Salix suchowensis]|nr:hypothetical protein OIU78_020767 [Salix suchowensis]